MRHSETPYPVVNYPKSKLSEEVLIACDPSYRPLLPACNLSRFPKLTYNTTAHSKAIVSLELRPRSKYPQFQRAKHTSTQDYI